QLFLVRAAVVLDRSTDDDLGGAGAQGNRNVEGGVDNTFARLCPGDRIRQKGYRKQDGRQASLLGHGRRDSRRERCSDRHGLAMDGTDGLRDQVTRTMRRAANRRTLALALPLFATGCNFLGQVQAGPVVPVVPNPSARARVGAGVDASATGDLDVLAS